MNETFKQFGTPCVVCGLTYRQSNYAADSLTCCKRCTDALEVARRTVAAARDMLMNRKSGKCEVCGNPTKVYASSGKPRKYCSRKCNLASRSKPIEPRECAICQVTFTPKQPQALCCSLECSRERKRQVSSKTVREDGPCHRRRSIKFGVRYDRIDPLDVFRRDGWMCQICLSPVDQDVVFPHPLCATLDHTTPLSRGGEHTIENVRTAHWCCNSAKGSKLDEELKCQVAVHQKQPRT